jgi:hypothetical protein
MRALKVLVAVLAMSLSLFAAESPFTGTWKLNLAKSTPPAPKSDGAVVDADHDGLKFNEDIVDDKGQPMKITYEAKFDGKDYRRLRRPGRGFDFLCASELTYATGYTQEKREKR